MRRRLTDSTFSLHRNANFAGFRDLYVTLKSAFPIHARRRSARSAVDDSGDLSPCRNTHAGGRRPGKVLAETSGTRNRASAWAAVPALA